MSAPDIPVPTETAWLPWCLSESPETSPHPGALPPIPAGGSGWLIEPDRGHLADCQSDLEAVERWLARQNNNLGTLKVYRHEIERFLLWLGLERCKALSEATGEDISLFNDLMQYPERWPQWYGEPRPRFDPRWRPWTRRLSDRSRYASLWVINLCYRWLVQVGYLRLNPVNAADFDLRVPRPPAVQKRFLDEELWAAVLQQIENMPRENDYQNARYHRARWVVIALTTTLARASEFTKARMGDLIRIRQPSGLQWWWQVRGKHRSKADPPVRVPIPPYLINELSVYRTSLGLSALPELNEGTPMILSLYPKRDGWSPLSRRSALWSLIKGIFSATADVIEEHNPHGAAHLRAASPHWLRHTGITDLLDAGIAIKDVQSMSRHRSLKALYPYVHVDRDALYTRVQEVQLKMSMRAHMEPLGDRDKETDRSLGYREECQK